MSVINQMLKDLDKRQEPVAGNAATGVAVPPPKNSSAIVATVSIVATLVVVAVIYLYFENQSLKEQNITSVMSQQSSRVDDISAEPEKQRETVRRSQSDTQAAVEVIDQTNASTEESDKAQDLEGDTEAAYTKPSANAGQLTQEKQVTETANKGTQRVQPASPNIEAAPVEKAPVEEKEAVKKAPKPVLNIARRNMSPDELVATKMAQAEQAMTDKAITKAEQLFEEVLLIKPSDRVARKQLAALLYGRQDVQSAVNILAQGIQIAPQDADMRLMLAKIYADRGAQRQALSVLVAQVDVSDVEYQSLIATLAQSMSEFEYAKQAYEKLIMLQKRESRWHLGAAIAHDSLGEFAQARVAYDNAIGFGSLSESAMAFAKQRLQELGDK